jgi:hypothetical protein
VGGNTAKVGGRRERLGGRGGGIGFRFEMEFNSLSTDKLDLKLDLCKTFSDSFWAIQLLDCFNRGMGAGMLCEDSELTWAAPVAHLLLRTQGDGGLLFESASDFLSGEVCLGGAVGREGARGAMALWIREKVGGRGGFVGGGVEGETLEEEEEYVWNVSKVTGEA